MPRALVSLGDANTRIPTHVVEQVSRLRLEPTWIGGEESDAAALASVASAASKAPGLAAEVIRLRDLLDRIYLHLRDMSGHENLKAELKREVFSIRSLKDETT